MRSKTVSLLVKFSAVAILLRNFVSFSLSDQRGPRCGVTQSDSRLKSLLRTVVSFLYTEQRRPRCGDTQNDKLLHFHDDEMLVPLERLRSLAWSIREDRRC